MTKFVKPGARLWPRLTRLSDAIDMQKHSITSDPPARLKIDGPIACIILDRPNTLNAIDIEMARCLASMVETLEAHKEVRVVVIRGEGTAFCAGGDIALFADHIDNLAPPILELLTHLHQFLVALRTTPKLVLTSVHGVAAGAGFSLAFMGDMCIAADDTRFRPSYAQLGVSPDGGGTVGVVAAVGARRAMEIFLANEEISATRAEMLGLVTKLTAASEIEASTMDFAKQLASHSPNTISATKQLIYSSLQKPVADQLHCEMQQLIDCMATQTFKNNVARFTEVKR